MSREESIELTNMCMLSDGHGNVLVQNKVNDSYWCGWNFPGGHVEPGEYITPSVIREVREETGLTIEAPRLCGIKEFHKHDGGRYIVFLYTADKYSGELKPSTEGEIFWYPLDKLADSDQLINGVREMLPIFTGDGFTEVAYQNGENDMDYRVVYY